MFSRGFIIFLFFVVSEPVLGKERDSVFYFNECMKCYKEIYTDLSQVSEEMGSGSLSVDVLGAYLSRHKERSGCMDTCMPTGLVYYDSCRDKHYIPTFRLNSIKREVVSAVKFLEVLLDTKEGENFFTGRNRSLELEGQYAIHHYENRFRHVDEAFDELEGMFRNLEECDSEH